MFENRWDADLVLDTKPELKTADFPDQAIKLIEIGISASRRTRRICAGVVVILAILFIFTINVEVALQTSVFTILVSRGLRILLGPH